MSLLRYNPKRDVNEREIVEVLRAAGVSVWCLDQPLDLILGYRGKTILAEVKQPKGKLNAKQERFIGTWKGNKPPVLRSIDDALRLLEDW